MSIREVAFPTSFTSTGASTWVDCSNVDRLGVYFWTAAGSSCTAIVQTAADSTSFVSQLGSSVNLNASSGTFLQFDGPFALVRTRVSAMTSTGTVRTQVVGI